MRVFVFLVTLTFISTSCASKSENNVTQPNVIVLVSDDLNFTELSCYGAKWGILTPNIDQLATEGVRFTNAYSTAPTCGPSRAGLLTGRYQTSFGHEFNSARRDRIGLPLSESTIGNRMQQLGYKTAIIGKWHLGGDESCGEEYHPLNRGFDYFFGFYGSMVHFFRSNHIFRGKEQVKDPRYLTDILVEESCSFIESNKDVPFFLYVAFNAVHTPLEAAEEDLTYVKSMPGLYDFLKDQRVAEDTSGHFEKVTLRAAMLVGLDRAVGNIMKKLNQLQLKENTIVIFTNDNGDYNGNGIYSGGKGSNLEGGIRVPFIVSWPRKIKGGGIYNEMVSNFDIMPTTLSAAGAKVLSQWKIDGVDLIPFLNSNNNAKPHEWLFWRMGGTKAARNGKWKLYFNGKSGYGGYGVAVENARWHLFDLESDPAEKRDLSVLFPEVFEKMKSKYEVWDKNQMQPLWPHESSGQMEQW
jgi:arylsulfatase A-like enzyme